MKHLKIAAGIIMLPIALPIIAIGLLIGLAVVGFTQVFEWLGIPKSRSS